MPFRFFRRLRIAPGLTLNVSKRGASVSAGRRGARVTAGTSGTRATAGLTGTGLHYTVLNPHKKLNQSTAQRSAAPKAQPPANPPGKLPKLGWVRRLTLAADARQFLDGWQAWGEGQVDRALNHFESVPIEAPAGADALWSAALLRTQREELGQAIGLLDSVLRRPSDLGMTFAQFGLTPSVQIPVTPEVIATMSPTLPSVKLLLAEVFQSNGQTADALKTLEMALPVKPDPQGDPVVLAAFGELALQAQDKDAIERFLQLSAPLPNESPVHTVVLYYRAQALVDWGLHHAALEVLTPALRRTKDRNPELMLNLRYLRAQSYQALGRHALARKDFERIFAQDPSFEGVAAALQ
jgi:tetratricopeptide (TPR) repeat protein